MASSETETETEQDHSTPKLALFSVLPTTIQSPEHPSGTATPPLYSTLASVPFTWEEQPGKPRPCTTLITLPTTTNAALEPPPRLYIDTTKQPGIKTPSPNTVLDGPYITNNRLKFTSSSFSIFRERRRQPSFDDSSETKSPEKWLISDNYNDNGKKKKKLQKRKGLFNGWGQKNSKNGKKEIIGGSFSSFVFPASMVDGGGGGGGDERSYTSLNDARIRRNGSFSSLSHAKPHFWASVYEGLKQVMPWKKSKKPRKEQGLVV